MNYIMIGREPVEDRGGRLVSPVFLFKSFIMLITLLSACSLNVPAFAQNPLSGFNAASMVDEADSILFEMRTFFANNVLPIKAIFFDHMNSRTFDPDHTNRFDMTCTVHSGFIYRGWRLSALYRRELYLETNRDTVEILRMVKLKQDLPAGRVFDVDIQANGFSATGLELSKGVKSIINGLTIGFTARYLKGEKIQEGRVEGQVTPHSSRSYDFDLFVDYIYDDNLIYTRKSTTPGYGNGYSFDLGLTYVLSRKFKVEALLRDIGGRIYWKDTPYTSADVTSEVKEYDQNGYQVYRPTIHGYESYRDFTQKIPLKTDILFSYMEGPFTLTPTINFIKNRPLYWFGLRYRATGILYLHAGYNLNYQLFSIGASYRKAVLSISGRDIDLNRAKAVGSVLSFSYAW